MISEGLNKGENSVGVGNRFQRVSDGQLPRISVIMPVYRTKEEYLREAIESVLKQTFDDFEFLILDDCPQEPREDVVRSYTDVRIKYFKNEKNLGIPQSYNKLLDLATGEYVVVMNHDDVMLPERLAVQYRFMEQHLEVGLVGTAYKKFGEINRFRAIRNPLWHDEICALLLFKSSVHHPTIMMRRALLEASHIRYHEDFISLNDRMLCYEVSKYSKLANLPQVLYKYRFHTEMTSKQKKDLIRSERAMFHKLWFDENGVRLDEHEVAVFDNYTTYGRQRFNDVATLKTACDTLEKLARFNEAAGIVEPKAFTKVCTRYATKRCLNALWHGKVNVTDVMKSLGLPVKRPLIKCCNVLFGWRR